MLHLYLGVAPFLLPNDSHITAPHLWHTDLRLDNIFVDKGRSSNNHSPAFRFFHLPTMSLASGNLKIGGIGDGDENRDDVPHMIAICYIPVQTRFFFLSRPISLMYLL